MTYKNIPMTDRVKKIRSDVVSANPIVDDQRALIVTQVYQKNESEPVPIKRAKALYDVLDNMNIIINEEELIVGNHGSNGRRSAPVFPEWGAYWLEKELDELETRPQDRFIVPEKVKTNLRKIFPYWRNRTVYDRIWKENPEEVKKAREYFIFTLDLFERGGFGHLIYDIPGILKNGFRGVKEKINEKLKMADISKPEQYKKTIYWKAALIATEAIINFANRFAREAEILAGETADKRRKQELLKISAVCRNVPKNPARNLWEAIQAIWFIQLVIQIESNGNSVSIGRLDQHLYPYFKKDIEEKNISFEEAQELLDCFWLKVNEIVKVWDTEATRVHAGFPMTQDVTIGGQDSDGKDATNELTYMILTTQEHIKLQQPQFTMRVHKNTPDDLMMRTAEIIRLGTGMPALFGDEIVIPSLLNMGIPLKKARDYSIVGCVESCVIGAWGRANGGYFNIARIVDLAINNGVDRLTGDKIGPSTGNPKSFTSFDQVLEATKKQMEYFVRLDAIENNIIDLVQSEMTPHIFASTVVPGCIENGKDLTEGGALYNWTPPIGVGCATAGDSLTAIKKLVFEEDKLTLDQLNRVLDSNFAGDEGNMVKKWLKRAPKYGNDIDEADSMVKAVTDMFFDEVEKYETPRGGKFTSMLFSLASTVPHGWRTGATADGRLAKEPISDSISPTNGVDKNGPTAVLKSASKLDHIRTGNGNLINLKFSKTILEDKDSLYKMAQLLRIYMVDLKGYEVQVNVVSAEKLKEAQRNPEEYRDLIIRVAGYSARFVELAEEIQNDIIARTEHQNIA